jgi:hypothetical protein
MRPFLRWFHVGLRVTFAILPALAQTTPPAPMQRGSEVQLPGQVQERDATREFEKALENVAFTEGQIQVPPQELKVGEVNELTLGIHVPGLTSVFTLQKKAGALPFADQVEGGEQELPVLYHADGSAYIRLVPMQLGDIELQIVAVSSERQFDRSTVKLHVGPSSRQPAELWIDSNGFALQQDVIRLDLDDPRWAGKTPDRRQYLSPVAFYPDVLAPVYLDIPSLQFKVTQPAGAPAIDFDKATGSMRPVRLGNALLETSYGGLVRRTCVQVRTSRDVFDRDNCKQLRAASPFTPPSPLNTTWSRDPDGLASTYRWSQTEFNTERIEVTAPDRPVELAQPLEIPVQISGGQLSDLRYGQRRSDVAAGPIGQADVVGRKFDPTGGKACGVRGESICKTVEIVPLALGEETVTIFARFADHGYSQKFFRLRVLPSATGLKSITLSDWPAVDGTRLRASLQYEQLASPIELIPLEGVKLTVEQPADNPVMRVDPDGLVHELRAGNATIVAEYAGVKTRYFIHACFCSTKTQNSGTPKGAPAKR